MAWTEILPGRHQRALGGIEMGMSSVLSAAHPREPLRIQAWADFTTPHSSDDIVTAFRGAWQALRLLKSPDIATTIAGGHKHYEVPNAQDLQSWLQETFTIAATGTSVDAAIREAHNHFNQLPLCQLIPRKTKDESFEGSILMLISHWRTEASGVYMMINQLLDYAVDILAGTATRTALATHAAGSEVQLLTPILDDILMPDTESTPEAKSRVEKYFADHYTYLPSIDFPITGDTSAPPTNNKAYQRVYTAASTSTIIKACKTNSISVTAAVHSAYIGAVWQIVDPANRSRSYASMMPAQVRKRLPASSPHHNNGCWDAARGLMLHIPNGKDFLTRARMLKSQYALADSEQWLHEDIREVAVQTLRGPLAGVEAQPQSMPWFTSFGVLDRDVIMSEHGALKVENVSAWADNVGPGIVMTVWTFVGQLNVQISWNLAYHTEEQVMRVLSLVDEELSKGLGIRIEVEEIRGKDSLY